MKNILLLAAGIIIGYFGKMLYDNIKPKSNKFEFGDQSFNSRSKLLTMPIDYDTAMGNINKFIEVREKNPNLLPNVLDLNSWVVERKAFDSILAQENCEFIRFYPCISKIKDDNNKDKEIVSFVLVGQTGMKLLLNRNATSKAVEGQLWDYIGPCPPKRNCPEVEIGNIK